MAQWLRRLAFILFVPLLCGSGSNPMRVSCQLLMEGCWFTTRNNLFLQHWKLTIIFNQMRLKNGVKHYITSHHLSSPHRLFFFLWHIVTVYLLSLSSLFVHPLSITLSAYYFLNPVHYITVHTCHFNIVNTIILYPSEGIVASPKAETRRATPLSR